MQTAKVPTREGLSELADRLRKARMEAGFKRFEDAARAAGLSVNTLKSYEYGKFVPSALNLAALARAYRVTSDWLLGLSSDPKGLPAGRALVDLDTAEGILAAETRDELLHLLPASPPITACIQPIPSRAHLMPLDEALTLSQKLAAKIHRLAPEWTERWERLGSAAADPVLRNGEARRLA
ncbi:MAG: helix-turn-helix domain-containing protein [Planctomycetota bacterium]